jgi:hypothetical protein
VRVARFMVGAVVGVGALVAEATFSSTMLVGATILQSVTEHLSMVPRVRKLQARVNELEHRAEVVYAEHDAAVDAELAALLEES